jgi:hypothetical protein
VKRLVCWGCGGWPRGGGISAGGGLHFSPHALLPLWLPPAAPGGERLRAWLLGGSPQRYSRRRLEEKSTGSSGRADLCGAGAAPVRAQVLRPAAHGGCCVQLGTRRGILQTQPPFSKQGRRSVHCVRVVECKTRGRSESELGRSASVSPDRWKWVQFWPLCSNCSTQSTTRKLCELYLGRMKPREILVEVRPCPNVQIGTRT